MIVTWSPQRSDRELTYNIEAEVITATLDGVSETYDFGGLDDGELNVDALESALDPCPVLSARRVDGQLEVTLLRFHGPDADESERFPEPEVFGDG